MQTYTATQIVADINSHIVNSGSRYYNEWYCGITNDINQRLFSDHNVSRQNDSWIWFKAGSDDESRQAEATMHEKGCKGAGGGGDESSVFVYAYKITRTTVE
jgi:hypothetical protein